MAEHPVPEVLEGIGSLDAYGVQVEAPFAVKVIVLRVVGSVAIRCMLNVANWCLNSRYLVQNGSPTDA